MENPDIGTVIVFGMPLDVASPGLFSGLSGPHQDNHSPEAWEKNLPTLWLVFAAYPWRLIPHSRPSRIRIEALDS
ncbi:MAG: hypothetical protein M0P73_17095 [Syntrophobacterales bacterium]|nr:hypothetical protein [Syntrophobacterales bacterium]